MTPNQQILAESIVSNKAVLHFDGGTVHDLIKACKMILPHTYAPIGQYPYYTTQRHLGESRWHGVGSHLGKRIITLSSFLASSSPKEENPKWVRILKPKYPGVLYANLVGKTLKVSCIQGFGEDNLNVWCDHIGSFCIANGDWEPADEPVAEPEQTSCNDFKCGDQAEAFLNGKWEQVAYIGFSTDGFVVEFNNGSMCLKYSPSIRKPLPTISLTISELTSFYCKEKGLEEKQIIIDKDK